LRRGFRLDFAAWDRGPPLKGFPRGADNGLQPFSPSGKQRKAALLKIFLGALSTSGGRPGQSLANVPRKNFVELLRRFIPFFLIFMVKSR
jgi:hypothetical protein